jgi:Spy/CpxP family protein refolding chaperone
MGLEHKNRGKQTRQRNGLHRTTGFAHADCPFDLQRQAGVVRVLSREARRRIVMKALSVVLTMAMTVTVCAGLFVARAAQQERRQGMREALAERIQDLNLTDEQETKVADIRKECRPKIQEAARNLADAVRDEVEAIRTVLNPEQKRAIQVLREELSSRRSDSLAERMAHLGELDLTDNEMMKIGDIRDEYRPKIRAALKQLVGVLTDDQKKMREDALKAGKKRSEIRESLSLSAEQKEKLESVGKELRALVGEEMEKVREVFTPEQLERLQDRREEAGHTVRDRLAWRIANLRALNLSEEQVSKINDIRKEYRPKVHEAGNALRGAIREELATILAVIKQ